MNDLANRMKENYELRAKRMLTRRTPVIIRIDGKAFHTYTKGMEKPFCQNLIDRMVNTTIDVAKEIQGCKVAYCQSDEVSFLLTDYDTLQTDGWFGYCQNKMESVAASLFTGYFNSVPLNGLAFFDARAFNLPKEEVINYFLWRMKDWERNSLSMLCGHYYSYKEMHGQGKADIHEMLHQKGVNWTDLPLQLKNGTWIIGGEKLCHITPEYSNINTYLCDWV